MRIKSNTYLQCNIYVVNILIFNDYLIYIYQGDFYIILLIKQLSIKNIFTRHYNMFN